ncbi:MAG: DUF6061 family protein [Oscillospiraceae bacterium]|jgi:hypothetical protein|nr:DUF6061 family protein [Oscillospiraceae bacterium]
MKAEYNIDNGCIDIEYSNGTRLSILCNKIEDTMDLTIIQRSEFDRLVYDHPLEFAELVLSGKLECYLKGQANDYYEQERNIADQLEKHYPPKKAKEIAREFMKYDS